MLFRGLTSRKLVVVCALVSAGCQVRRANQNASTTKIDSGIYITDRSQNAVPAVVWIGNCTATAVSDNTLVTAAHCVERMGADGEGKLAGQICVRSGKANGKCSKSLWMPPEYPNPPQAGQKYKYDVAVGIFDRGTFANYFPLQSDAAAAGQDAVLVGFSDENQTQQGLGSKRWGRNKIDQLRAGVTIVSNYNGSADGVAVSPGDSGGPLFVGCKLTGVASRMSESDQSKISLHTNLTITDNNSWLRKMFSRGGYLCGLDSGDDARCAANGMASPLENPPQDNGQPGFPCAPSGGGGTVQPPSGEMHPDLREMGAALVSANGGLGLWVALPNQSQQLTVCLSVNAQSCDGQNALLAPFKTQGGRSFHKLQGNLPVAQGQSAYLHIRISNSAPRILHLRPR